MKKSNEKRRVRLFTLWAALIVIAASLFTACPDRPKPTPTPALTKFKVDFSVDGKNGSLTAAVDGKEIKTGAEVEKDKTVVFTAKPAAGYKVKAWTLDGKAVNGTAETYPLKITKAVKVRVSFESTTPSPPPVKKHKVSLETTIGGNVSVSPALPEDGMAAENTELTFKATPLSGYTLEKWELDGEAVNGTELTYTLKVTKAARVKVSFKTDGTPITTHTVTLTPPVNGTVTSVPALPPDNKLPKDTEIVFTAEPNATFAVDKWTITPETALVEGGTDGEKTAKVKVNADTTVAVKFKYTGADLLLDTRDFTKEQGKSFTYKLVTSGSKNYTAVPETDGFFTLDTSLLNSSGIIKISCTAPGASRIKVTDNLSGQTALSGLITVTPVLPDYFAEGGVRYHVTDKENRYVSVTARTSSSWSSAVAYTGTSLTIPAKVTHDTVEYTVTGLENTYEWGDTLQSVTVEEANAHLSSQGGVIFNKDKTKLLYYPWAKPDTEYTVLAGVAHLADQSIRNVAALQKLVLPEELTYIGSEALFRCPNLTDINVPSTLRNIKQGAFTGLPITSIALPEGLSYVSVQAFYDCPNLTTVELPASLRDIAINAFGNCTALTKVTCKAVNPPAIGVAYGLAAFHNTPIASATLKVPQGSEAAYRAANVWKDFGTIEAITP